MEAEDAVVGDTALAACGEKSVRRTSPSATLDQLIDTVDLSSDGEENKSSQPHSSTAADSTGDDEMVTDEEEDNMADELGSNLKLNMSGTTTEDEEGGDTIAEFYAAMYQRSIENIDLAYKIGPSFTKRSFCGKNDTVLGFDEQTGDPEMCPPSPITSEDKTDSAGPVTKKLKLSKQSVKMSSQPEKSRTPTPGPSLKKIRRSSSVKTATPSSSPAHKMVTPSASPANQYATTSASPAYKTPTSSISPVHKSASLTASPIEKSSTPASSPANKPDTPSSSPAYKVPRFKQNDKQTDKLNDEEKHKQKDRKNEKKDKQKAKEEPIVASEPDEKHVVGDADESTDPPTTDNSQKKRTTQDPFYRKPFEYGWKRELVWRANYDSARDKADVYFITPKGKKLRARSDIIPLLEGDLTIDHFCFTREPLDAGPEFESIRFAKSHGRVSSTAATLAAAPPTPNIGKRVSKPKGPKGASPPPQGWTATKALKVNNAALHTGPTQKGTTSTPVAATVSSRSSSAVRPSKLKRTAANDIENDVKQINDGLRSKGGKAETPTPTAVVVPQMAESTCNPFAANLFSNVSMGYAALLNIMRYLKIHERTRAASVCKLWNLASKDTTLWATVRMKNAKVYDWAGFTAALRRGETKHLDLRKMLPTSPHSRGDDMWQGFVEHIGTVCSLEEIDLCKCSSRIVESLCKSNKNLRVVNALSINGDYINIAPLAAMRKLEELRLRTVDAVCMQGSDLTVLMGLTNLVHLQLTAVKELGDQRIEGLRKLTELRSLELGECNNFDETFAETVLPRMKKLQRLRLENGQESSCCALTILEAVARLDQLTQLELVNFDIKPGFAEALQKCTSIRKLLVIPTYLSQSATTNHIILSAVQKVAPWLRVFTWGVTLELLRVTALYVDQCEESTKKEKRHFDECIPVLKPVPGARPKAEVENDDDEQSDVPQIEILPLDKVEVILAHNLPNTKFKIIKVPYHATCKQQIVEQ